jgi:hypothetical protein
MIKDLSHIPDEWIKHSEFNCLTKEQFHIFQNIYQIGDSLGIDDNDCECETYIIDGYHRCSCGNRRCTIVYDTYEGKPFFRVEVW